MSIKKVPLFFLLLISFNILYIDSKLNPSNVEIAINCGGPEFRTKSGITYQKDNYLNGGEASDFGMNSEIKNTKDKDIYQTERWSTEDLIYEIPIQNKGRYVLILKFSEVYFNSKGEKIFDFKLGDLTVLEDIDIYEKVGKNDDKRSGRAGGNHTDRCDLILDASVGYRDFSVRSLRYGLL